jgi:hypothetical protein
MYNITGVCKDCGAGTLNGNTNPQFELISADDEGDEIILCKSCHSRHVDVTVDMNEIETWIASGFENRYGEKE